jgi:hypothetical protein
LPTEAPWKNPTGAPAGNVAWKKIETYQLDLIVDCIVEMKERF